MRFESLLRVVGEEPVFESGLLLTGDVDPADVRRQLARWARDGRLLQLRRGLYALAPPYRKVLPHPFLVANRLALGSYVSLQSALGYHGLIPEHVPVTTSVTTGRPGTWETPLGTFEFHHLHPSLGRSFRLEALGAGQQAFVATPAKALADLVHLVPGADDPAYLQELRLQDLEGVMADLARDPTIAARPKLRRAFRHVAGLAQRETQEAAR